MPHDPITLKQFFAIITRRPSPPWRATEARAPLGLTGTLSLRSVLSDFQAQNAVVFVQIRGPASLASVTNLAELSTTWKSTHPGRDTLNKLSAFLANFGCFVVTVSKDGQTIGIGGPIIKLASVPTLPISSQQQTGVGNIITGALAVVMALGLPEDAPLYIALPAAFGGGGLAGLGLTQVTLGEPAPAPTPAPTITQTFILVFGPYPSGLAVTDLGDVENWPESAVQDLGEVENWPEAAGAGAPVVDLGEIDDPPVAP